jgi:iron(III) transport system substrate-binding protein
MQKRKYSKRDVLRASAAWAASAAFAPCLRAAPLQASAVMPALTEAARKEGGVTFYTALDLQVAERLVKTFEARYPGVAASIERSGSERMFERISQEQADKVRAVDVVCSTNASHFLLWKRGGFLAPYLPRDVAAHFPADQFDADGMYATVCAWLIVMGYNTKLVKAEDAPKSFADLLDPRWAGKLVKAHPGYSGSILTATFSMVGAFGWGYFDRLARQNIMQVQSAVDPPKRIFLGERAVMVDGNDYNVVLLKERSQPVEVVYPAEGAPLISTTSGIFRDAPHPNAARLFQSFLFSAEAQQLLVDTYAQRSFHAQVKDRPGRTPLSRIKLMKSDPAAVEAQSEDIKMRYASLFGA